MNINKYTIKSQEALQAAIDLARRNGNQSIEPAHLLGSLLSAGDSLMDFLFSKLAVQRARVEEANNVALSHLPKVSGGEPYLSQSANEVLNKAEDLAREMQDEYVAVEHILMALVMVDSPTSMPRSSITPLVSMRLTSASVLVRASSTPSSGVMTRSAVSYRSSLVGRRITRSSSVNPV